jgi:flavin-binding protein dodecin
MSVARVTEITATSSESFDDAVAQGIARATKTLKNVKGAWIQEMTVDIDGDRITTYRANMKVTFVLED